jgi:glycosyltransferase involved in cell wall biosynthesis
VSAARLVPQKRPRLFLDVVDELLKSGLDVRATMIGDGNLRAEVERIAADRGLPVSFLGWREPWWEAVEQIDCLVLTSFVEGFPNVLVEAACRGIPCVASGRALGTAEAIIPGVTGELAMPDTARDYAAAVLRALRHRHRSPLDITAWLERFSTSSSVDCLLAAVDSVMVSAERAPSHHV